MAGDLQLFIDIKNRRLVTSLTSPGEFRLPALIQGEVINFQVFFVQPTGNPVAPLEYVDFSGSTLEIGICGGTGQPTGTLDDPDPTTAAYQNVFSEITNGFSGQLDLRTQEIADLIGSGSSKSSTFEVELTPPAENGIKYLQTPVTIKAAVIEPGSTVPQPKGDYLLKTEAEAGYVKKVGDDGDTIIMTSPNGRYQRILGVRDDGSRQDDVIDLQA